LVTAEPLRRAWSDALVHAARLDHFTDMLVNAAELAGVSVEYKAFGGGVLALIAEPGASTRAELFKAWQTKPGSSRVGRWGELLKCGAPLRAHNIDEGLVPYHPDDDKVADPIDPRKPSKRAAIA
jgi:hypothetical protein